MKHQTVDGLFHEIYDATYHSCLVYVTCKCSNTGDIPDILQETYLSLYRILDEKGADYIKNPEAYVIRIAKSNIYKHYLILEKIQCILPLFNQNEEGETFDCDYLISDAFENPLETEVIHRQTLDEIWNFLKSKPQGVQKVFTLFYYANISIPQIAQMLNLNESTVKNRIYRTTREIRTIFRKDGTGTWTKKNC